MSLKDVAIAALSRPAGRVVEGPVRELIDEALKDRGYASPAELAALKEELAQAKARVEALPSRLDALEQKLAELGRDTAALREALQRAQESANEARRVAAAAEARAAAAESRAAELESRAPAAEAMTCRAPGCGQPGLAEGFCRAHTLAWRAGRLAGFVSPEGLVDLDGRPGRVSRDLAGHAYQVDDGRVRVAGRFAAAQPL